MRRFEPHWWRIYASSLYCHLSTPQCTLTQSFCPFRPKKLSLTDLIHLVVDVAVRLHFNWSVRWGDLNPIGEAFILHTCYVIWLPHNTLYLNDCVPSDPRNCHWLDWFDGWYNCNVLFGLEFWKRSFEPNWWDIHSSYLCCHLSSTKRTPTQLFLPLGS